MRSTSRPARVTTRAAALGGRLLTATDGAQRAGAHRLLRGRRSRRARHCIARRCPRPPRCGWANRRPASPRRLLRTHEREVHPRRVRPLDALGVGCRHRTAVPRRRARGRHRRRPDRCRSARPVHHTNGARGRAHRRRRPPCRGRVRRRGSRRTRRARRPHRASSPARPTRRGRAGGERRRRGRCRGRRGRAGRPRVRGRGHAVDGPAGRSGRARPTGCGRERADRRRREHRVTDHDGLGR